MIEQNERQNRARLKHDRWATACNFAGGCRYTELILAASAWVRDLPATVEAFLVPVGGHAAIARAVQQWFRRAFKLAQGDAPPLVEYGGGGDAPFRILSDS